MSGRRAPAKGYDFPDKSAYREFVWGKISEHTADTATAQVLMLPSAEAIEPIVAGRYGFREQNMHLVDDNPAIIARHICPRYPDAQRYGRKVSEACRVIGDKGIKLSALSLDFTAQISRSLGTELHSIAASHAVGTGTIVAVTVLRGRDPSIKCGAWLGGLGYKARRITAPHASPGGYGLNGIDHYRVGSVLAVFGFHAPRCLGTFTYRSVNGQTFLVIVLSLGDKAEAVGAANAILRAFDEYDALGARASSALRSRNMQAYRTLEVFRKKKWEQIRRAAESDGRSWLYRILVVERYHDSITDLELRDEVRSMLRRRQEMSA